MCSEADRRYKAGNLRKITTTKINTAISRSAEDLDEHIIINRDEGGVSHRRFKQTENERIDENAGVDIETLRRRVHEMSFQPDVEDGSEDELERLIREAFDEPSDKEIEPSEIEPSDVEMEASDEEMEESDTEMEDAESKAQTEQEQIDEAWAAYDGAIAEDPTLAPKPQPIKVPGFKTPIFRQRKRDVADDLANLTTTGAVHALNLKVSFDMSDKPKYLQSQKAQYEMRGYHATTIREFFETLWYENEGRLILHGYPLKRVQSVKRLEIKLFLKERKDVKRSPCWSIKGNLEGREQCETWKTFLDTANSWGRKEAAVQQKITEWYNRAKRKRCMKDDFGNLYDHTGNYYRETKCSVHADVDAEIVLHFD